MKDQAVSAKIPTVKPLAKRLPWFRFDTDRWRSETTTLKPLEKVVYIEVKCLLFENSGFVRFEESALVRRCFMRPTSLKKALAELVRVGLIDLEEGFLSCNAVTEEIQNRTKFMEKSAKTRLEVAEKGNKIRDSDQKVNAHRQDTDIKQDSYDPDIFGRPPGRSSYESLAGFHERTKWASERYRTGLGTAHARARKAAR